MGRKLRIAILYNEPVTASKEQRQYEHILESARIARKAGATVISLGMIR